MKRVAFLLYLVTSLAVPHGLAAQTPTDSYIAQLQALGYSNISIGRTFLGRHRILADRDGVTRELIVARNGQLLFDYMDNSQKQPSFEITAPADDDAPTAVTRSVDQTDDVDSSDDADANAEIVKDVETETDQTDDASDPDQQDDGNKGDEDDRDDGKDDDRDDDDKGDEDGDDKDEDEDRKPVTQPVSENAQ